MKKVLLFCGLPILSLFFISCGFSLKPQERLGVIVPTDNSRVILQDKSIVPIRTSSGGSVNFHSTLPNYQNIASVLPPPAPSNTGDVQATAIAMNQNTIYISYNTSGGQVYGAIDVIDVTDPNNPVINYTYFSSSYEFSDLKVQNNILYLSGYNASSNASTGNAILMVVDVSTPSLPTIKNIIPVPGIYATSVNLENNTLMVSTGTSGGVYKYDISANPLLPTLVSTKVVNNSLYAIPGLSFDLDLNGATSTVFQVFSNLQISPASYSQTLASTPSVAPSRFTKQNSLVYINNTQSKQLSVLDLSSIFDQAQISQLGNITIPGTANGILFDQQLLYLAQGEDGFYVVDVSTPNSPNLLGNFVFSDDGSANNVWINKTPTTKYLFLADGRQGVRILTSNLSCQNTTSPTIQFYARSQDYQGSAQISVRVNNVDYQTVTLNKSYQLYSVNYSRALNSSDKVELVLLNQVSTGENQRNAFVSYLAVNGFYCYQQVNNNNDDLGLMQPLATIGLTGSTCSTYVSSSAIACTPGSLQVPTQSCTLANNDVGQMSCDSSGKSYSCKDSGNCIAGYSKVNGTCQAQICNPNSVVNCSIPNGAGNKTCSVDGMSYGSCQASSCQSGYYNKNGSCVAQVCTPNSKQSCSLLNFVGTETCDASGSSYSSCDISSSKVCTSGYYLNLGSCVAQKCTPGSSSTCLAAEGTGIHSCNSTGSDFGTCTLTQCNPGYHLTNNTCVANVCTPGAKNSCVVNNLIGTQSCDSIGSSLGSCVTTGSTTCSSGYYYSNGSCLKDVCSPNSTTSCSVLNGSGQKSCDATGSSYGSCVLTSCNSGFYQSGSTCLAQVCSPQSVQACAVNNLVGKQTCNTTGSGFGACVTTGSTTCSAGYYYSNGACIKEVCSPNSTASCSVLNGKGVETCNSTGSGYGTCTLASCNSGFYQSGSSCLAQVCTPNSKKSCEVDHLIGSQSCDATGSAYGSCVTTNSTTCSTGYYYSNGTCKLDSCVPNSVISCEVKNGTGQEKCDSTGSALSSCSVLSCNKGFYQSGQSCVTTICTPQSVQSCTVNNLVGKQTCNTTGSGFGACVTSGSTTCSAGYYYSNGSCLKQVCTPLSTANCSVQNGKGVESCDSIGSKYGSCLVASCNSGFYKNGSTCSPDLCAPNSVTTCSVNNLIGKKSCDATGSAYGSCVTTGSTTCATGYHYSNGACIANLCSPNSTTSCSVTNGTGVKSCDATGSSYGSCLVKTCNSGFYQSGSSCVAEICKPGSVKTCSVLNGMGKESCDATGSAYGACVLTNCNPGFYESNRSCVAQICTPDSKQSCVVNNLIGTKSCNQTGSGYDSCKTTNQCVAGYYFKNGSCLKEVCSPNSTQSCSGQDGTGLKRCDSVGSGYGSCVLNRCDVGHYLSNGQCLPQVCSPNSTQVCSEPNGSGLKSCDTTGSGYGDCVIKKCNAGYTVSNNRCIREDREDRDEKRREERRKDKDRDEDERKDRDDRNRREDRKDF